MIGLRFKFMGVGEETLNLVRRLGFDIFVTSPVFVLHLTAKMTIIKRQASNRVSSRRQGKV